MNQTSIFIVSSDMCHYCVKAKDFLKAKDIPSAEFNMDKISDKEKFEYANCIYGALEWWFVPFIFMNGRPIGSYGELIELEKKGRLEHLKNKTADL